MFSFDVLTRVAWRQPGGWLEGEEEEEEVEKMPCGLMYAVADSPGAAAQL